MSEQNRDGGRTDSHRGKRGFNFGAGGIEIGQQAFDGGIDQRSPIFTGNHQAGLNLSGFNHIGNMHHAVEHPQACVGDIKYQGLVGQFQVVMDDGGGSGFQKVTAHGTGN